MKPSIKRRLECFLAETQLFAQLALIRQVDVFVFTRERVKSHSARDSLNPNDK